MKRELVSRENSMSILDYVYKTAINIRPLKKKIWNSTTQVRKINSHCNLRQSEKMNLSSCPVYITVINIEKNSGTRGSLDSTTQQLK